MKRFFGTALLVWVVAVGAHAVVDGQAQPKATVQKEPAAIPRRDDGNVFPGSGVPADKQRAVSRESIEYLQKLRRIRHSARTAST